jgi:hypothetical protein
MTSKPISIEMDYRNYERIISGRAALKATLERLVEAADVVLEREQDNLGDDWMDWGDLKRLSYAAVIARHTLEEMQ